MSGALETVVVTPQMRDMIRRRTDWIVRDFVYFERSLKTALANAYIAGMNDAIDVLAGRYDNEGDSSDILDSPK